MWVTQCTMKNAIWSYCLFYVSFILLIGDMIFFFKVVLDHKGVPSTVKTDTFDCYIGLIVELSC